MKKALILGAFAALLSVVSCRVEEPDVISQPAGTVTRYISAAATAATKTSLEDPMWGRTYVKWSDGDEIGVVVEGTTTVRKASLIDGAGTGTGTFEIEGATAGERYSYAIYPYSYAGSDKAPTVDGSIISVNIPSRQPFPVSDGELSGSVLADNVGTMVGTFSGDYVQLHSLCGVVKVKLTGSESRLYGVHLQSDSNKLSGAATIDMSAGTPALVMADDASSSNYIHKNTASDEVTISLGPEPTPVYFVLPEGTYDDLRLELFSLASYRNTRLLASTSSINVVRNTVVSLSPIDVAPQNTKGAKDLCVNPATGEPEYANCYLVNPNEGARYKVKMVFRGDSREILSPAGHKLFTPSGNVAYVWTEWESEDGLIQDIERLGDWVYFSVKPGAAGNALLQAANTSLEILWSCHIWVSDAKDQPLNNGYTFLDRNLGATYSPASKAEVEAMSDSDIIATFGCYYQWGNPLPRPGIVTPAEDYEDCGYALHPFHNGQYGQKFTTSTLATAGFNRTYTYPNYFYSAGTTGSWTAANIVITGEDAWWQPAKTALDPCPPGYRVPDAAALTGNLQGNQKYDYRLTKGGNYKEIEGQFVWIPFAGIRVCGNSEKNSGYTGDLINYFDTSKLGTKSFYPRAHLWYCGLEEVKTTKIQYGFKGVGSTLTSSDYPGTTYYQYMMSGGTVNASGGGGSDGNLYSAGAGNALFIACAASIRCVKE